MSVHRETFYGERRIVLHVVYLAYLSSAMLGKLLVCLVYVLGTGIMHRDTHAMFLGPCITDWSVSTQVGTVETHLG